MVPLLISEKCGNFSDSYESEEEMQEVSNRPKKKFKPPGVMSTGGRNNRRKTVANPTQYIPLCNPTKYGHTYDRTTGLITVKNKRQDRSYAC
ncbi:16341_t:CDS:2 [Rhizophagus irregularis]|nr:16341_t:CDS:2 [Rhizophagus irregularis]